MKRFKHYIVEADTSESTELENSLCYYYNKQVGGLTPAQSKNFSGITSTQAKSYPKISDGILTSMGSYIQNGPYIKQSGREKGVISSDWKKWGATSTDYKTDVYECDLSGKANGSRYSMKNQSARILGAAAGEANATFKAAYKHYEANGESVVPAQTKKVITENIKGMMPFSGPQGNIPKQAEYQLTVNNAKDWTFEWYMSKDRDGSGRYKELRNVFGREVSDDSIEKHMKNELWFHKVIGGTYNSRNVLTKNNVSYMISKNDMRKKLGEYAKSNFLKKQVKDFGVQSGNIEKAKEFVYNLVVNAFSSETWQNKLREVLETDQNLKRWVIFEAASGWYKFSGQPRIIKSASLPREVGIATHMLGVGVDSVTVVPMLKWANDNRNLVSNIAINFKSSGNTQKTSRRAWNILSIAMESYENFIDDKFILDEGVMDFLSGVGQKISSLSRNTWNNIVDFFTGIVDLAKEAWNSFLKNVAFKLIDYIVDLLDRGIDAFLSFLGYEIEGSFS